MITPTSLVAFGRPHTLIGTTLQCITSYWIPIFLYSHHPFTSLYTNIHILLSVWLTSICINIWAVGLNQLMDHELDRINKPNLPLPCGMMSRREAWILTITCGCVGVIASLLQGPILAFVIIFIMIVTTAYSMPQIFLKGSPLAAGLAIALSRGIVGHIGTFLHFSNTIYHHMYIPIFIWAFAIFTFLFGIAIAILKDVPDMQGDAEFHVRTLAVRIGGRRVFQIALSILTCGYIALTIAAMSTFTPIVSLAMATCHIAIISALWIRFIHFSFQSKPSTTYAFYMDVWKCFQLEFVVVCLAVACRGSSSILVQYS